MCGCGKWQGCGIPCKHALWVIYHQALQPADFVSPWSKGAFHKLTYSYHIHHNGSTYLGLNLHQWKEVQEDQPSREEGCSWEKKHHTVKCGKWKQVGHNSRTCQGGASVNRVNKLLFQVLIGVWKNWFVAFFILVFSSNVSSFFLLHLYSFVLLFLLLMVLYLLLYTPFAPPKIIIIITPVI